MQTSQTFLLTLVLCLAALPSRACAAGATVVYDFTKHFPEATISNALMSGTKAGSATSGGVTRPAVLLHPGGAGDATATYHVELPALRAGERLVMTFGAGMSDGFEKNDAAHPSDGVRFALRIDGEEKFERDLTDVGWADGAIDLTGKAGRQIEVVFATNPKANSNYDWASWSEPLLLRLGTNGLTAAGTASMSTGIITARALQEGVSIKVTPLSEKGATAGKTQVFPLKDEYFTAVSFDFAPVHATSVKVVVSGGRVADLGAYAFEPQLELVSVGPSSALLFGNKPVEFRCTLRNTGKGVYIPTSDARASLLVRAIPGSPSKAVTMSQPLVTVFPGEDKTIAWKKVTLPKGNTLAITANITASRNVQLSRTTEMSVALRAPESIPQPTKPEARVLRDGSVVLQNKAIRMTFVKNGAGFVGWVLAASKAGKWETVASSSPMGKVQAQGGTMVALAPTKATISSRSATPSVMFSHTGKVGASPCSFAWTFKLNGEEPRITASQSVRAVQPVKIVHFSGPTVYAGDGSFGAKKSEGLFPGLEYLLSERSSGTENVSAPNNVRTVPHPNKITIPLMAIRNSDALVSLEWDPLRKWDGAADRPAAMFASPNFLDSQDNHKMGIFIPSVPKWTAENRQVADKPYELAAGSSLVVSADIVGRLGSTSILDAVDGWIARHGIPDPPDTGKTAGQVAELCEKAYLETIWDESAKGWKHTNTSQPAFDTQITTYLLRKANFVWDKARREKFLQVANAAIDAAGRNNMPLDVALLAGNVQRAVKGMGNHVQTLIASQKPDGSWPFNPDQRHSSLGRKGDSSSGFSATSAETVLQYALITGDEAARESGLKAIKYLDTQMRPEGAQTWELQLHVPDILASARLVTAYVYALQLTGDPKYLDRAVYWAKSGLPFVYLWNATDRPIMRYGTIPVFGATWFDGQPWFGVCVQWCGMDYAYAIAKLADFDKSLPWEKIAQGILNCGVQQQDLITTKYPQDAGMYPDAYSPVKGDEEYHWDLNPGLISRLLLRLAGSDPHPSTYSVPDQRKEILTVTLPIQKAAVRYQVDWLHASASYAPGATVYGVIGGVYRPESITVNSRGIDPATDLDAAEQGWWYDENAMVTYFKFKAQGENTVAVDLLMHELRPEDVLRELEKGKKPNTNGSEPAK